MTKKIIGICGFIGSGKDTAADYLVDFYEFQRDSFAASLKDIVAAVFGWDRSLLEGRTSEAREWREQIDPWWADRLGIKDLTPRWVLQYWGTEVCRRSFHNDIWIASLENRLRRSENTNIVISDCRFPNEVTAIKKSGGKVIRIVRGENPPWYNDALIHNSTADSTLMQTKWAEIHASEWAWIGTEFDHVVDNNGELKNLYLQLAEIVR